MAVKPMKRRKVNFGLRSVRPHLKAKLSIPSYWDLLFRLMKYRLILGHLLLTVSLLHVAVMLHHSLLFDFHHDGRVVGKQRTALLVEGKNMNNWLRLLHTDVCKSVNKSGSGPPAGLRAKGQIYIHTKCEESYSKRPWDIAQMVKAVRVSGKRSVRSR